MWETQVQFLVGKIPWRREWQPTLVFLYSDISPDAISAIPGHWLPAGIIISRPTSELPAEKLLTYKRDYLYLFSVCLESYGRRTLVGYRPRRRKVRHDWATSLSLSVCLGFPCGSASKKSVSNAGDLGSIPGLGRSPGEGKGYPLQYSGLENSMDSIVHGVTELDATEWLSLHFCMFKPTILYFSCPFLYLWGPFFPPYPWDRINWLWLRICDTHFTVTAGNVKMHSIFIHMYSGRIKVKSAQIESVYTLQA